MVPKYKVVVHYSEGFTKSELFEVADDAVKFALQAQLLEETAIKIQSFSVSHGALFAEWNKVGGHWNLTLA